MYNLFDLVPDFYSEVLYPDSIKALTSKTEEGALIEVEVPGYSKEELEIKLENNTLSVEGKSSNESLKPPRRKEFIKRFRLPNTLDASSLSAKLDKGILTITVKNSPGQVKKIAIS